MAESILAHISGTRFFPNMRFVQEYNKKNNVRTEERKDGQTLVYRTLPATTGVLKEKTKQKKKKTTTKEKKNNKKTATKIITQIIANESFQPKRPRRYCFSSMQNLPHEKQKIL